MRYGLTGKLLANGARGVKRRCAGACSLLADGLALCLGRLVEGVVCKVGEGLAGGGTGVESLL